MTFYVYMSVAIQTAHTVRDRDEGFACIAAKSRNGELVKITYQSFQYQIQEPSSFYTHRYKKDVLRERTQGDNMTQWEEGR